MKTLANLIVLGNEELGRTLENHLPGAGVIEQVRTVPQGTALNKALVEGLKGLDVQTVGVVVVMGDDDSLAGFVARLEKAAFRTLVVGEGGVVADPFTPDDVIAALNELPETDFILPIGGEDGEVMMSGSGLAGPEDDDAEMGAIDGPADEPGADDPVGAEVPAWAEGSDGGSAPPWMISDEDDVAEEESADEEGPAEDSDDEEEEAEELVDREPDWGDPDDAPVMPAWASEPDPEPAVHPSPAPAAPAWASGPDPSPDVPAWATEPDPEPAAPAWAAASEPEATAQPDPVPAVPAWVNEADPEPEVPTPPARPEAAAHPTPAWASEHAPTQDPARSTPPTWASESPPIVPEVETPTTNGWATPHPNSPAPAPSNGHEAPWAATGPTATLSESLDQGGPVEVFNAGGGNRRSGTGPQVLVFASYKGGAGKCLTGDALIHDPVTGLRRRLDEVVTDRGQRTVLSFDGRFVREANISAKIDSGVKPTLKITTQSGREVTVTPHHPMLTPHGWTRADSLVVGETIAVAARIQEPTTPEPMDAAELDLLAALMGEGGTSTHGTTVSTTDPVLLDLVVEAAAKIGAQVGKVAGDNVDYALTGGALTGAAGIGECMCGCGAPTGVAAESSTARGYAKGDRLRFAKGHTRPETTLKRLRREHGLDFTLAKHKVMPHAVFRLPNDQLARFLGILWMCDGYVGDRRKDVPGISFASQRLVEDVQHLLLRFGIQSSVRHKTARIGEKEFDAWRCEVYRASVPRFAEAIPLWGEKASRAVARASSTTGWHFSGAPTMTDDQWVELREDLAGRSIKPVAEALGWNVQFVGPSMVLRQKPRKSGQRSFCVPGLRACIEMYPDLEAKWGWLVDSELWWDPVVSVEDAGQQQVWDLSVGETANFVANDLVVHNTSTALQAAAALAEAAGKPGEVVLVDANTAQASISTLLDLRNEAVPDIMRLLDPPWDPKKVTRSLTAIPDTNLHVLFAPHNKRDKRIRNITPQLFRRIVNELRSTYRYIVIDTPVAQNVGEPIFDEFVFTDADALVIVTNPEKESQENNLEFAEIACDPVAGGGRAFPMQHLWILLNRARDGVGYDEVNVRDEFRQYNFAGSVPESDAILRAANDGRLHLASSPARDALLHALANITGDESLRPSSAAPTVDGVPRGGGWRGLLAKVGLG